MQINKYIRSVVKFKIDYIQFDVYDDWLGIFVWYFVMKKKKKKKRKTDTVRLK